MPISDATVIARRVADGQTEDAAAVIREAMAGCSQYAANARDWDDDDDDDLPDGAGAGDDGGWVDHVGESLLECEARLIAERGLQTGFCYSCLRPGKTADHRATCNPPPYIHKGRLVTVRPVKMPTLLDRR